jgi:uncharacterized membrane protein
MMGGPGPGQWWPLMMLMPLVMLAGFGFVAWMLARVLGFSPQATRGGRRAGSRGGPGSHESGAPEDPLAVVRERYARGEISHDELDRYLDTLLRTDPALTGHAPRPRRQEQSWR